MVSLRERGRLFGMREVRTGVRFSLELGLATCGKLHGLYFCTDKSRIIHTYF